MALGTSMVRARSARVLGHAAALVVLGVLTLGMPRTALAQGGETPGPALVPGPVDERDDEARALYQAGVIAFESGRFRNALDAFQRAYELSQRPELLYNVGSAADRMRLDAVALDAFERYLAAVPNSPHASSVQARIDVLRAAVEQQRQKKSDDRPLDAIDESLEDPDHSTPTPSTAPAPAADEPSSWPKWTLIGAGGGVLVGGVVMLAIGQRNRGKIEDAAQGTPFSEVRKYDNADTLTAAGIALAAVGLASATVGTLWLIGSHKSDQRLGLNLTPTGVVLRGAL